MLVRACMFAVVYGLAAVAGVITSPAARAQPTGDPAKVKALIVGVAQYKTLGQLPRSAADARGLYDLLASLGVPKANIRLLPDPATPDPKHSPVPRDQIRKAWEEHLASLKPNDVSIFFFSGHGAQSHRRQYLLGSDFSDKSDMDSTGLALADLIAKLRLDGRKNLGIFIVDACRNVTGGGQRPTAAAYTEEEASRASSIDSSLTMAPVRALEGTFVYYAASVNQMALHDLGKGDDSELSVYTRVLLPLFKSPDRSLHDVAKDARWQTYELALKRKSLTGSDIPHTQIPAYFDDALYRRNILGKLLPVAPVEPEKSKAPGPIAGLKGLWACASCPEMVEVPAPTEPVTVRGREPGPGAQGVAKAFLIGKYEVTREEWRACEKAGVCRMIDDSIVEGDRHPMTGLTWQDTQDFLCWLNALQPDGKPFRVPTEAEWEHAARGGSSSDYGPADEVQQLCDFANGADASLKTLVWANPLCSDGKARGTTTAGSYRPNGFGIHDMQGNVWEWVDTCYDDPACKLRIAKGGSWRSGPEALRIGAFQAFASDVPRATVGFRVARDSD